MKKKKIIGILESNMHSLNRENTNLREIVADLGETITMLNNQDRENRIKDVKKKNEEPKEFAAEYKLGKFTYHDKSLESAEMQKMRRLEKENYELKHVVIHKLKKELEQRSEGLGDAVRLLRESEKECENLKVILLQSSWPTERGEQKIQLDEETETKSVWIVQDKAVFVIYGAFDTEEKAIKYVANNERMVISQLAVE